jgi:cellulose synthase/poly-beta-1,6-N-acetylglucosamine synthase-like glycosyltransferase
MFAYGIIECFRGSESLDLMSWQAWDPRRLRFGNFIDAMALIRRAALLEVGGYSTDPRMYGWEDLALWCSFADRGWNGIRIPRFVARYRASTHSMVSVTNIDHSEVWAALVELHPSLTD